MAKSGSAGEAGTRGYIHGEATKLPERRLCAGGLAIETVASIRAGSARGVPQSTTTRTIADGHLIEVELEGGIVLYTSFAQLRKDYPTDAKSRALRGAPDDAYVFPAALPLGGESRGLTEWAVKAWNLLSVKFEGETEAAVAAHGLGWLIERRVAGRAGLHPLVLDDDRALEKLDAASAAPVDLGIDVGKPVLVFIHGTGSRTAGGFEGLWKPENVALRASLAATYGRNVLAFEHRTLSLSPIRNALDLARALPVGARLHLVTHSRGGLVGELLARGNRDGVAFDDIDLDLAGKADASALRELRDVLKSKRLHVDRFVRVACPARGTSLASGRLDRYLSVIINVMRLASIGGSGPMLSLIEDFTAFAAAVIERRKDPRDFPGLEAMMPESRFIRMINRPDVAVQSDLTVIAGDAEPQGVLKRLALLVTDLYYDGDHDFVVDTANMIGGAVRPDSAARVFRHQGGDVSHFRYFVNAESSRRVVAGLLQGEGFATAFATLQRIPPNAVRAVKRGPRGPAPVVFVLPGIMGSALGVADGSDIDTIWMDFIDLARGGLCSKLPFPDRFRVVAEAPLPRTYGRLIDHLGDSCRVVPFAYDWRISLMDEARRLAERLIAELDRAEADNQPVHIVAHSMGGLLTRALIAFRPEVWRRVCAHPDARVLMLGTPTRGSHSITRVLGGDEKLVNMLAVLDLRDSKREILDTIARYPGVLELLPDARALDDAAGTHSLLDEAFWRSLGEAERDAFALPAAEALRAAGQVRAALAQTRIDSGRLIYVAGKADETPVDFALGEDGLEFVATDQGDGRVPWRTGIPPDAAAVYYLDAVHGDMADTPDAFAAFEDLLKSGSTTRLPTEPPAAARGLPRKLRMKPGRVHAFPDEASLEIAVRGGAAQRRDRVRLPQVRIAVRHGDLRYTTYPVLVGHYFGDSIVSAEAALDRFLDHRLSARLQVGLYPGLRNTADVFLNPDPLRPSAIVIGLGAVGELSVGALADCFANGLLRYAAQRAETPTSTSSERLSVAALLIGTGGGGLELGDSLTGLMRGMRRAAEALAGSPYSARVSFEELELLELFEDRAISTVHAVKRLAEQPEFREAFVAPVRLESRAGGRRRAMFDEAPGWWQRLQVTGAADGGLSFVSLTQRARAEMQLQALQRPLVDRFLEQAREGTATDPSIGVTLFELLLPNELKQFAPDQSDLVMILDEVSARYPWELLSDRTSRDDAPMVVERGVLRQLQTTEYRHGVANCRNDRVLVIGDPLSKFPELPGAQREAEAVANRLAAGEGAQRFQVTRVIRENARTILREMMARDYRIVHLAGHGVFEHPLDVGTQANHDGSAGPPARRVSGMVIGDDVFLTPVEVAQMRQVPELVFINCCHLGRVESGSSRDDTFAPHRLAANLAVEFIRMGVRAVIAAGWEVDDAAAHCFADAFYASMLAGDRFGKAVQAARRETWQRHAGVNTWGAYQCYGDPDYRLREVAPSQSRSEPTPYLSRGEARVDLHNLACEIAASDDEVDAGMAARIGAVEARLDEGLRDDAVLRARLGALYYDAGDCTNALRCFGAIDAAQLSPSDMEHYANAATLHAEQLDRAVRAGGAGRKQASGEARYWLQFAIELLARLLAYGQTAERYCLMGSAQKRRASMSKVNDERRDALEQMAYAYSAAARIAPDRGDAEHSYALLNAWTALMLLDWHGGELSQKDFPPQLLEAGLPEIEAAAQSMSRGSEFWDRARVGDCALLRLIASDTPNDAAIDAVADAYRMARILGSRPREWNSVLAQIESLAAFAESGNRRKMASALERLVKRLRRTG